MVPICCDNRISVIGDDVAIPSKSGQWFRLDQNKFKDDPYDLSQSLLNQVNGSDIVIDRTSEHDNKCRNPF